MNSLDDADLLSAVEWDVVNWCRAVRFWQEDSKQDWSAARVLELGARDGGLSLWFAKHGANVIWMAQVSKL